MKKVGKIAPIALIVLLLAVALIATLAAESYTGTTDEAARLLKAAKDAASVDAKLTAIEELNTYMEYNPIDPESEGYSKLITDIADERLVIACLLLDVSELALGMEEKRVALDNLDDFIEDNPLADSSEGFQQYSSDNVKERFAYMKLFIDELQDSADKLLSDNLVAENGVKLRYLTAYMKAYPAIAELDGYTDFKTLYDKKLDAQEKAKLLAYGKMQEDMLYSDYLLGSVFGNDFEALGSSFVVKNSSQNGEKNDCGVEWGSDGSNKYYTVRYKTTAALHTHLSVEPVTDCTQGIVVDFDFTTFGKLPSAKVIGEQGSITYPDGYKKSVPFFSISPSGDLCNASDAVVLAGAVVPGEWLHITMIWTPDLYVKLYVDYELVSEHKWQYGNYSYNVSQFRIGASTNHGEFSLDNFKVYMGTSIRDVEYMDAQTTTDADRFVIYTKILQDDRTPILRAFSAYEKARALTDELRTLEDKSEELVLALEYFDGLDYEQFLAAAKTKNAETYYDMAAELLDIERVPDTYDKRKALLEEIDEFALDNAAYMAVDENYSLATDIIAAVRAELDAEATMTSLDEAVKAFFASSDREKVEKKHKEILDILLIVEKSESIKSAMLLPEFSYVKDSYTSFKENAGEHLSDIVCIDNTKNFIEMVGIIERYETEADWEANFELIDYFCTVARSYVSDIYDPYYPGFKEAYEVYEPINNYFYARLQTKHVEYIKAALKRYDEAVFYSEKLGICIELRVYIDTNDLEAENDELNALIKEYELRLETIESERDAYLEAFEENTRLFLETMEELAAANGHLEKRALIEKASSYTYAMNIDTEKLLALVTYLDDLRAELLAVEENTKAFIAEMNIYSTVTDKDEAFALMLLMRERFEAGVEESLAGAAAALDGYEAALSSLYEDIDTVNLELSAVKASATALLKSSNLKLEKIITSILNK